MEQLLGVREGTLPNTVFCLLAPDGKTQLTRPSRGPSAFRTPQNMAIQMQKLASRYKSKVDNNFLAPVPLVDRVDLAMNVAASDNRPLLVLFHPDPTELRGMLKILQPLAWNTEFTGQFMYAATSEAQDLKSLSGKKSQPGMFVVEPDEYGTSGRVTRFVGEDKLKEQAAEAIAEGLKKFVPFQKNHQQHIRNGYTFGIEWETIVPESDPMSVQAKQRFKARFNNNP